MLATTLIQNLQKMIDAVGDQHVTMALDLKDQQIVDRIDRVSDGDYTLFLEQISAVQTDGLSISLVNSKF